MPGEAEFSHRRTRGWRDGAKEGGIAKRGKRKNHPDGKAVRMIWWGMVDSNHRRRCQQIYSLSPLATREIPHIKLELVDGFEPPTC